jgi:hypothetical protein
MISDGVETVLLRSTNAMTSHNVSGNCWNVDSCPAGEKCWVRMKTASAGYAQCHVDCPPKWLCETREGGGCGPSPLPQKLKQANPAVRAQLDAPTAIGASLCDRHNPPKEVPTFEITCYDGGQTGNRFHMVMSLLGKAACCGGVALLPPEFDHLGESGATCFDFSALKPAGQGGGDAFTLSRTHASCASTQKSSKVWWTPRGSPVSTLPTECTGNPAYRSLLALAAATYVGISIPGVVWGSEPCAPQPTPTLVMHMRSGDIFTNWQDGKHHHLHAGFQHAPNSRGQPPLAFYTAALEHHRSTVSPASNPASSQGLLVTAPDMGNPVASVLLGRPLNVSAAFPASAAAIVTAATAASLSMPVRLSANESFKEDLTQLLCARSLLLADSSLNSLLLAGSSVRDVYFFSGSVPCSSYAKHSCGRTNSSLYLQGTRRYWCVAVNGKYSVAVNWLNSEEQRNEMLTMPVHPPVEVQGTAFGC